MSELCSSPCIISLEHIKILLNLLHCNAYYAVVQLVEALLSKS